jgi:hypothetical protein
VLLLHKNVSMKKLTIVVLLLLAGALPAQALSTKDILSLVAMPLAVAAVSDLTGVPQDQLADVVSTLNQADVPPNEFNQVLRYVPVALAAQPTQDQTFAQWLDAQAQSTTGPELVTTLDNRLATTYGVTPVVQPDRVVYVDESYIPDAVVTRLQPLDPVALAAMPLAVAAMSELTGVPQDQLGDLAAALNQADVPPTQFVQVVSYAPQTLVQAQPQPAFVDFVRTQTRRGVRGPALVTSIDRELPRFTGPPGQVKKQLGLQTGAEVVHGGKRGHQFEMAPVPVARVVHVEHVEHGHGEGHGRGHGREVQVMPPPMTSAAPPPVVVQPPQPVFVPPGQAKKEGGGEEHGHGGGKGRGHGKD